MDSRGKDDEPPSERQPSTPTRARGKTLPAFAPREMVAHLPPLMARVRLSTICFGFIFWLGSVLVSPACQVPVFRYALERWAPTEYLVSIVPAEGGFTDAETKALEILRAAPSDSTSPVNLEIQIEPSASGARGPAQIALRYPHKLRDDRKEPIWEAALTEQNVQRLLDSPVRRELRRRLLAGESTIWVLVESGDPAKDGAAAESLTPALAEAQSSLKLPDGVLSPEDSAKRTGPRANEHAEALRTDLPLKIEFSLLRLSRNDPAEAALLAMLTHLEDDLGSYAKEPMVFPVFGRGRVLEPLIGAGIHRDNVMEHSRYLCGACSCEVKDQNPGIDLLVAANWQPMDTTPQLEIIRITPRVEAPPARVLPVAAISASVISVALGVWLLRRRATR